MKIQRIIKNQVINSLDSGFAIVILGARQVGKTTLIKDIAKNNPKKIKFINCDDINIRQKFVDIGLARLKELLHPFDLIIFDEAQRIKNIGITLKLIIDEMPNKQLIITGSSSLELANTIDEPLTGRKKTFKLFPISFLELFIYEKEDKLIAQDYLQNLLRFGSYPRLFNLNTEQDKTDYLLELAGDYLYKDVLEYQLVKNPEVLRRLLVALALQIGQEVSFIELANTAGIDQKTVIRYIDLLEKSFVIFRLPAFSRNMRTEIVKSRKFYFYDLGIRNALINNFNPYELRTDKGQVWENFLIAERIKRNTYKREQRNYYFWRTYDQKEIDLIEEYQGKIYAFEFKWKKTKIKKPKSFITTYKNSEFRIINQDNYIDFIT